MSDFHIHINHLTTELQREPLGIDTRRPRFGWKLTSEGRNKSQKAYRIQLSDNSELFYSGRDILWDTGKVISSQSVFIEYAGPVLKSFGEYDWRVKVWDEKDVESDWSDVACFEMGILDCCGWTAKWVEPQQENVRTEPIPENPFKYFGQSYTPPEPREETLHPCQFLRKKFGVSGKIKKARIYATAHGIYTLELNGHPVDDREFAPEFTDYDKYLAYQTYDVTEQLTQGDNVVGAVLADGWYAGRLGMFGDSCQFGNRLGFLLQLRVEYEDGTVQTVASDRTFKSSVGPYIYSDIFIGEKYDARRKCPDWSKAEFDDSRWTNVLEKSYDFKNLAAQYGESVRKITTIPAAKVITTPKGETVIDLGQNIAGRMRMKVAGPAGTKVTLEHSEMLDENGNFMNNIMGRNKDQTDVYILNGRGEEIYEPKFTFHGFRYVRLTGYPGTPSADDFEGIVLSSDFPQIGSFECSDKKLNRLQQNIVWSQRSNMLSIPTDCPQRERTGWTGDIQVFLPTGCYNMELDSFITRWLRNVRLDQKSDGQIPFIVPDLKSYQSFLPRYGISSAGWGDACIIVPWTLYRLYGDKRVLKENYEMMAKWLDYVKQSAEENVPAELEGKLTPEQRERQKYLWNTGKHFGDWLIPSLSTSDGSVDMAKSAKLTREFVPTCYFAYSAELMSKIAKILGKEDEAEKYLILNEKIRSAFAEEYLHEDGSLTANFQGIYVLALKMRMVPDDQEEKVFSKLVSLIEANGKRLDTGFLSVAFLLDILCEYGRSDLAFDLLFQTKCPSWLYEVEKGATTIWEAWQAIMPNNKVMNVSYNHYAFGCVGDWMYRNIAGIILDKPGYSHFSVCPKLDERLTSCKASYQSSCGDISVQWSVRNNKMTFSVMVPTNTTATVKLPNAVLKNVAENGKNVSDNADFSSVRQYPDYLQLEVGSGDYSFTYSLCYV